MDLFFDYEQQKQSIQQQFSLQPQPGIFSSMLQQTGNANLNHQTFFAQLQLLKRVIQWEQRLYEHFKNVFILS